MNLRIVLNCMFIFQGHHSTTTLRTMQSFIFDRQQFSLGLWEEDHSTNANTRELTTSTGTKWLQSLSLTSFKQCFTIHCAAINCSTVHG